MLSELVKGYGTWTGEVELLRTGEKNEPRLCCSEEKAIHRHGITVSPRSFASSSGSNYNEKSKLHKTYVTRNGALVLFSEDSRIDNFSANQHSKSIGESAEDFSFVGSLSELLKSVLALNEETADNSTEDDKTVRKFLKTINDANVNSSTKPGGSVENYLTNLKHLLHRTCEHDDTLADPPSSSSHSPDIASGSYRPSSIVRRSARSNSGFLDSRNGRISSSEFQREDDHQTPIQVDVHDLQSMQPTQMRWSGKRAHTDVNNNLPSVESADFTHQTEGSRKNSHTKWQTGDTSYKPLIPAYNSTLLSGRWVAENAITNIPAPPSSPIAFDSSVTSLLDYDQKFSRPLKSQSHNHGDLPVTSKRTNLETFSSPQGNKESLQRFTEMSKSKTSSKLQPGSRWNIQNSKVDQSRRKKKDKRHGLIDFQTTSESTSVGITEEQQQIDILEETVSNLVGHTFDAYSEEDLTHEEIALEEAALKENLAEAMRYFQSEVNEENAATSDVRTPRRISELKCSSSEIRNKWKQVLEIKKAAARAARQKEKERRLAEEKRIADELLRLEQERIDQEEQEKSFKQKQLEEALELERRAEEARRAEEVARAALVASRIAAREQRDANRRAIIEQKKKDALAKRAEDRRLAEIARQREKQMLESIASAEEKRKFEEAERKRREEEEYQEMLRAEEEERLAILAAEAEEERFRQMEMEAEEEAMAQLVEETEEAEHAKATQLAEQERIGMENENKKRDLIEQAMKLREDQMREKEEEEFRQEEARRKLIELQRLQAEAVEKMKVDIDKRRHAELLRREHNLANRIQLHGLRWQQTGITKPWVFSYFPNLPRKPFGTQKKKNVRSKQK